MKHKFFIAIAAFFMAASANAQSTVDSIAAKYKLLPMPDSLTMEQTFPVLGRYQLSNAADSAANLSVTLDSVNKGIVWVEGLPQGRVKAYLKKSPSTYRIMPQKTAEGKQIPEGTLIFDPSTNTLNVAIGKAYDEADPNSIFAANAVSANTTDAGTTEPASNPKTKKVKTKTSAGKSKARVTYFTATKVQPSMTTNANTNMNMNSNNANTNMNTNNSNRASTDSTRTTTDSTSHQ